ncbi:hypothetical protein M885DRAFT_539445 [Pelagophyceae sp. CCMP2097]|nr:hypothetical protein M885DRAFT_539445 [Pelagophyceae sp. CCMP2097]
MPRREAPGGADTGAAGASDCDGASSAAGLFTELVARAAAACAARRGADAAPAHAVWAVGFVRRAGAVAGMPVEACDAYSTAARRAAAPAGPDDDDVADGGSGGDDETCFVLLETPEGAVTTCARRVHAAGFAQAAVRLLAALAVVDVCAGTYDARARAALKTTLAAVVAHGGAPAGAARAVAVAERRALVGRAAAAAAPPPALDVKRALEQPSRLGVAARVSLAAAGGGAALAISGGFAAPSLAASLLCGASAAGAAAATEATAAVVAVAITGVFASLGATVSGFKARRRFAADSDWALVDRHPVDEADDGDDGDRAVAARFVLVPGWQEAGDDARCAWGGTPRRGGCGDAALPGRAADDDGAPAAGKTLSDSWDDIRGAAAAADDAGARRSRRRPSDACDDDGDDDGGDGGSDGDCGDLSVAPPPRCRAADGDAGEARFADCRRAYDWWSEDLHVASAEHVLVWESDALQRLHATMKDASVWVEARDRAARGLVDEVLRRSALGAASVPLALLERAAALDDPWGMCVARARDAGRRLARWLAARGDCAAVTLVGYSLGARVVMHCLEELADLAAAAAAGGNAADWHAARHCVENAVLLGAPVSARAGRWAKARSVVCGRLVNGFSSNDCMLRLVYRAKAWSLCGVAGAGPITAAGGVEPPDVENVDLSDLVSAHLAYPHVMRQIFARLHLED